MYAFLWICTWRLAPQISITSKLSILLDWKHRTLSFPSPQSRLPPIMFNLRTAAVRAAATSVRAQSTRVAGPQRISVITTASWASKKTTVHRLAGFSTRSAALESQRPIEPLDETVQPGTAPNPTLESEELLRRAQERKGEEATQGHEGDAQPRLASRPARGTSAASISHERNRTLFVGNAPYTVSEADIRTDFGSFGEIESVYHGSLAQHGWLTITFSRSEDMRAAAAEADGSFWHNRRIAAKPRETKSPFANGGPRVPKNATDEETAFLYVGNIPRDLADAELTGLISELADVQAVRIATKPGTNELAGYAHIDFKSTEAAVKARAHLANLVIKDRSLRLGYTKNQVRRGRKPTNKVNGPSEGTDDSPAA